MIITTNIDIKKARPNKKPCTLLGQCAVEPGVSGDYKLLCNYHYRDKKYPPAVHQVYRARYEPTGKTVGVIVYAAPALNLGVRNKIFGNRYKIAGKGCNDIRAARLNKELELIIRVVVHPTLRGTGLGIKLIAETLLLRPYRYVEMSAAMGALNPFAEKAGMKAVQVPRPDATERVLSALRSVGMTDCEIGNPQDILNKTKCLPDNTRGFIEREITKYAMQWIRSRTKRKVNMNLEVAAARVSSNAMLRTMYYIWENKGF